MEPSLRDESYEAFKDRVNHMPTPDLVDLAFDMTQDRIRRAPGLDIYVAIENEVDFVRGFLDVGAEPTVDDRESISMGVIAVRNFEEVDPRYAKVLVALAYRFRHQGEPG